MIDADRLTTSETRIEFLDAWTDWDDACHRTMAAKGRPSAFTLRRETDRHVTALAVIAREIGMQAHVVQHLLAALRRVGFDREEALRAVEAIAIDRRHHRAAGQ